MARSTDALVQEMDAAVNDAVKALAADEETLRLFCQYIPLHRFVPRVATASARGGSLETDSLQCASFWTHYRISC